jgi:hypothetical protein
MTPRIERRIGTPAIILVGELGEDRGARGVRTRRASRFLLVL